ncbi:MAG: SAM-dependent methyltransferase, partial [Rhodospirillales bacterium]
VLKADFLDPAAPGMIEKLLDGKVDLVLSDMAPSTTGHRETDHLRIAALVEAAIDFAVAVLRPGGNFVTKFRQGQEEQALIKHAQRHFAKVVRMKPPSSRAESSELFLVSTGFKG